ncbi:hypothetical protein DICVIV_07223 [Dictyocaulus viviparus]|uniref:C2H2-type domain-containing protein n=1 Tax=Dictyocaulus viviparus TaxID=29172 RepID=A0A0D8XSI2_DICVI|nr:hypothetical protein DICVIV_07223 [Dictyocaulus viviparus]
MKCLNDLMVYILVDLENQTQLSDVITFLISRSYNVFHVNNVNPCPKCNVKDDKHNANVPNSSTVDLSPKKSVASDHSLSILAPNPEVSGTIGFSKNIENLSQPIGMSTPYQNATLDKSSKGTIRTHEVSFAAGPVEAMESAAEFEDVKPMINGGMNESDTVLSIVARKEVSVHLPSSAFDTSTDTLNLSQQVDDSEGMVLFRFFLFFQKLNILFILYRYFHFTVFSSENSNLWASTRHLIKKQKLGATVSCFCCKWSVKSNLKSIRTHVNNIHKRFHRYRCSLCKEEFVHLSKATLHKNFKHGRIGTIIPLKWTPYEVKEIEKAMVQCFGFEV